ncbi:hypothetical protein K469DRAFT_707300 [Zopfia rhizophila CBS 207.26]|uniref:DUF7779 domain-containing protein n=1 Tax=Zopfia rhizophila CBS 207.26 TaxID=1314779 RepID=A0A6A6E2D3_9PEZI|nr:hypothetical protein K469DRAFT_707300 [Zopfia rhizophila CBS 207.26]
MSFFNPQGIPEWILQNYSRNVANLGDKDEGDSGFDEDLDTLQVYSLITATADKGVYEIHALVQFCTRVWLSTFNDLEQWNRKYLALMAREFPYGGFKNWAKCQQLLPHIESLYVMQLSNDDSVKEWVQVLNYAVRYIQTA